MKIDKAERRDKKKRKQKDGIQVDNKGIFILEEQKKKKGNK